MPPVAHPQSSTFGVSIGDRWVGTIQRAGARARFSLDLFHPAFTPVPSVIVGQSEEKTVAALISPSQNRTKCPGSYRSGVIVGQKRLYLTRMAHNDENCPAKRVAKWDKAPQPGRCCGATDAYGPRSHPDCALGGGIQAPQDGKGLLVPRDHVGSRLPASVWPEHEEFAYAIRRFDRDEYRGRIYIEDLAQVRNVYPDQKYDGNFETVASLLDRASRLQEAIDQSVTMCGKTSMRRLV